MSRIACLFPLLMAGACTLDWHQAKLSPHLDSAHVMIWAGGREFEWQRLRVFPDSVTGIPMSASAKCDSCRVGLARASVDSVREWRMSTLEADWWGTVILVGLVADIWYVVEYEIRCAKEGRHCG